MRLIGIISLFIFLTGCSGNFASFLQVGGTSVAIAQKNSVSLGYNVIDFGVKHKTGHTISQNILHDIRGDNDE